MFNYSQKESVNMEKPVTYSIKAIMNATGKSRRTIAYFEDKGLLPSPKRDSNNYRVYYESDIELYVEFFKTKESKKPEDS